MASLSNLEGVVGGVICCGLVTDVTGEATGEAGTGWSDTVVCGNFSSLALGRDASVF